MINPRVCEDLSKLCRRRRLGCVEGIIEFGFDVLLLALRSLAISYWIKACSCWPNRATRSNVVDIYCLVQFGFLFACAFFFPSNGFTCFLAIYFLSEIYLNLFNIVFIGKFSEINDPPVSVERSLLLLFSNVIDVIFAFAFFYRYSMELMSRKEAVLKATLVMGTVGYPEKVACGAGWFLVPLQIFLDFVLVVLFPSSFVGQIGLFRRAGGTTDWIE